MCLNILMCLNTLMCLNYTRPGFLNTSTCRINSSTCSNSIHANNTAGFLVCSVFLKQFSSEWILFSWLFLRYTTNKFELYQQREAACPYNSNYTSHYSIEMDGILTVDITTQVYFSLFIFIYLVFWSEEFKIIKNDNMTLFNLLDSTDAPQETGSEGL